MVISNNHVLMQNDFSLDLKTTRKQAGLTQKDCGHLLGGSESRIKQLEGGTRLPTLPEMCTLSLIYGRSFECLFTPLFADVRKRLGKRLGTMPDAPKKSIRNFNRKDTLDALAERLLEEAGPLYGG